jgi:hypothetical protein
MNRRRLLIDIVRGMMLMTVLSFLGAVVATAQPLAWNPPCKNISFVNYTTCNATITLVTVPGGVIPPVVVPPGGPWGPTPVPAGTSITGLVSGGGLTYGMVQPAPVPPPPAPPPVAPNGWIPSVNLGSGFCCNDVYFDLATCTVYIFPSAFPCRV